VCVCVCVCVCHIEHALGGSLGIPMQIHAWKCVYVCVYVCVCVCVYVTLSRSWVDVCMCVSDLCVCLTLSLSWAEDSGSE